MYIESEAESKHSLLIKNGYVVTMDPARRQGAMDVLIEDDRIARMAPGIDHVTNCVIDASGQLVLPGFVQGHLHLCQSLFRGLADDEPLAQWLDTITELESRHTADTLYTSAQLGLAETLKAGTTSIIDMGTLHYQDSIFQAMMESGIRGQSGKAMMDLTENLPPTLRETTEDSLRQSLDLLHRWHGADSGRIRYGFAPRWQIWNTDRLMQEVMQEAERTGTFVHGHGTEAKEEVQFILNGRGRRPMIDLAEVGMLGPNVQMAHCIWLDEEEMRVLKDTRTHVLHCPCSNLKTGSGFAPIPEMLAKGISVALGSDGAPSNNNLDLFIEMRVASLIQKGRLGSEAMTAEQVLTLATNGGAAALGLAQEIGSLEPGKKADIIILDDGGLAAAPIIDFETNDPVKRIVTSFQSASVQTVIVNGRLIVKDRSLLSMNETEILQNARQALRTILDS